MSIILIVLVLIATLAVFYLKCSMMQSLTTLWSAVLAVIITFSYYEIVAELFISRGYGLQWAHAGCFLVVFIVSFGILRTLSDFLIRVKIDLGSSITLSMQMICGLVSGIILSGVLLTALGLAPLQGKLFCSRFDSEGSVAVNRPKKTILNVDGFVAGLYKLASAGSLSSHKSFGVLHADYLTQMHLNKLKAKDNVLSACSVDSLVLPRGKGVKPVRLWTIAEAGEFMVVRAGIVSKKVEDGGANDANGKLSFFPAQLRLITKNSNDKKKNPFAGTAKAIYPKGFLKEGGLVESALDELITPESAQMKNRIFWVDVVFEVPSDQKPVLLEFRQNAVVDLSSHQPVKTSQEIEDALNTNEKDDAESQS